MRPLWQCPSYHQDLNAVCNLLGRLRKLGDGPLSSVPLGYRRGAWMAGVVFGTVTVAASLVAPAYGKRRSGKDNL